MMGESTGFTSNPLILSALLQSSAPAAAAANPLQARMGITSGATGSGNGMLQDLLKLQLLSGMMGGGIGSPSPYEIGAAVPKPMNSRMPQK